MTSPELQHREFRAMGSPARVVAGGVGPVEIDAAVRRVHELEGLWSRFRPDSEISRLNQAGGALVITSPDTHRLLSRAIEAEQLTNGRFNPFMLDQLERLGYSRPWQDQRPLAGETQEQPASAAAAELLPEINGVRLPADVRFDPGGIGKGLAVDLVTEQLLGVGATTVLVDIGGDLRVEGEPWYGDEWRIGMEDPFRPESEAAALVPVAGAVATSSRLRRAWLVGDVDVHHILDPSTGCSAATDLVTATACSSVAWWADVVAKVALMAGSAGVAGVVEELRTPIVAVAADGTVIRQLLNDAALSEPQAPARETAKETGR